jgi:hypothetical protein
MAGGGKGGSTTNKVTVPAWLETAAQGNLARANQVSQIGYTPYYGADVAAMTPTQIAAMQNTGQAASAFGLGSADPMDGMPQAQTFAGGVQGYSSAPMYQQSVDQFAAQNPGQAAAMANMFINPQSWQAPAAVVTDPATGAPLPKHERGSSQQGRMQDYAGVAPSQAGATMGGYTGLSDMINGGGPGASGATFQGGGLLSGAGNLVTRPAGQGGSSGMGGGK